MDAAEKKLREDLVLNHDFKCLEDDEDAMSHDVRALRLLEGLCPVCGNKPRYNEAVYCGAGCAARDGA
jgi:hypothetical protein